MRLTWQQIPSTIISDILCQNELDGVVLDTEHSCYNKETLYSCIQVITSNGKKCFVRLGKDDVYMAKYCLDAGCDGIIFSTVETKKQCENIINSCYYPSDSGQRGLGLVRQNRWGTRRLISDSPILIAQVETTKGVQNIRDLDGFDYYMIGPYDLTASLGCAGKFDNISYIKAVEQIKKTVPIHKMAVHIPKDVKKEIKKYEGYGIIAIGMDTTILVESYREMENA
tara:strand:- start:118 stop:795 length:678 start_codon:yes stop_codon:yes gene_type:complete